MRGPKGESKLGCVPRWSRIKGGGVWPRGRSVVETYVSVQTTKKCCASTLFWWWMRATMADMCRSSNAVTQLNRVRVLLLPNMHAKKSPDNRPPPSINIQHPHDQYLGKWRKHVKLLQVVLNEPMCRVTGDKAILIFVWRGNQFESKTDQMHVYTIKRLHRPQLGFASGRKWSYLNKVAFAFICIFFHQSESRWIRSFHLCCFAQTAVESDTQSWHKPMWFQESLNNFFHAMNTADWNNRIGSLNTSK